MTVSTGTLMNAGVFAAGSARVGMVTRGAMMRARPYE